MTSAEAWFNNSLRPRKPEGSLGRTAQDGHLDSHTAPEHSSALHPQAWTYIYRPMRVDTYRVQSPERREICFLSLDSTSGIAVTIVTSMGGFNFWNGKGLTSEIVVTIVTRMGGFNF